MRVYAEPEMTVLPLLPKMYRVVDVASREVLSLDEIETLNEAVNLAREMEQPGVAVQQRVGGEWVTVAG